MSHGKLSAETIKLKDQFHSKAEAESKAWIGRTLRWKDDARNLGGSSLPTEGRKCVVRQTTYDTHTGNILVLVKTERADGKGYIDDNDMFHRIYRNLDEFEVVS